MSPHRNARTSERMKVAGLEEENPREVSHEVLLTPASPSNLYLEQFKTQLIQLTQADGRVAVSEFIRSFPEYHSVLTRQDEDKELTLRASTMYIDAVRSSEFLSMEEKARSIFNVFDTQGLEVITKTQVLEFMTSTYALDFDCLSSSNPTRNIHLPTVVDQLFSAITSRDYLTFEEFHHVFAHVFHHRSSETLASRYTIFSTPRGENLAKVKTITTETRNDDGRSWRNQIARFRIARWIIPGVYLSINVLRLTQVYLDTGTQDPVGGWSFFAARASAQVILLHACLVLLPICRNVYSKCRRQSWAWTFFNFDLQMDYHQYCATILIGAAVVHSVGWATVIFHAHDASRVEWQTSTLRHLEVRLKQYHATLPFVTGVGMWTCLALALPFTIPRVRRDHFNWFWYTHLCFLPFFVFLLMHGGQAWLGTPVAGLYVGMPCLLYLVERRRRFSTRVTTSHVLSCVLTSDFVILELSKPRRFQTFFQSGMYLYLNVPALSRFEWHPFTISSAPESPTLTLHIRQCGDWTRALYRMLSKGSESGYPAVHLDGPVGGTLTSLNYGHFEYLVFIGAGIGITPFASILKSIVHLLQDPSSSSSSPIHCRKLYFYWITNQQECFSWFQQTLNDLIEMAPRGQIEIHTYLTSYSERSTFVAPLRLFQTFVHQEEGTDIISGLKNCHARTHWARPQWPVIFKHLAQLYPEKEIGVFLCGSNALDRDVAERCHDANQHPQDFYSTTFRYHSENF